MEGVSFRCKAPAKARRASEGALQRKLTPSIQGVCRLFLARCFDIAGDRVRALELYRQIPEGLDDPRLLDAFRSGKGKQYRDQDVNQIMVDLQFPDTLAY